MAIILLLLLSGFAYGQTSMTDTTYTMKEVVVKSNRLQDLSIGSSIQKLDPISLKSYSNYSFGDLLAIKSQVFIKSYGPGGLASPSIRGGAANHTAVIWNGVSINSPMNGGVDLSLLPVGFIDDVRVQYGGSGTLYGSGAVSGIIHLGNADLFKQENSLRVRGSGGSFYSRSVFTALKIGNENIASSFKYFGNFSDNDFEYIKLDGSKETQTNAGIKQHAFLSETQIKTSDYSFLKATIWYQFHDKEMQTLMSATSPSEAFQENKNLRLALNWNYQSKDVNIVFKSVYLKGKNFYVDPAWSSESLNESTSWINEIESKFIINEHQILIGGLNLTAEKAESGSYTENAKRNRTSAFISHKFINLFDRLTFVNSIRQEIVESDFLPIVFSSGFNLKLIEEINLNGNISRTYNLPGLNDLFWAPSAYTSGNPDLKAEYGWSGDIGFEESFEVEEFRFSMKQNLFFNNLNDWIVWLPDANFVWMPVNKNKGKSHGFDFHLNVEKNIGESVLSFSGIYTWTSSNFEEEVDGEIVKTEMVYVPKKQLLLNIGLRHERWDVNYTHNFVGERIYFNGSDPLESYSVGNIAINYSMPLNKNMLTASLQIRNAWNKNYQVINNYAMPGKYLNLSITYDLNF